MSFKHNLLVLSIYLCYLFAVIDSKRPPNPDLYTDESCKTSTDCKGASVFCNEFNKCECQFGFYPRKFVEPNISLTLCMSFICKQNTECHSFYGGDTWCENNRCFCQPSFKYFPKDRQCLPTKTRLNDACRKNSDCDVNASCDENLTCKCKIGKFALNEYACTTLSCENNEQCQRITANSSCTFFSNSDFGYCYCNEAYKSNPSNTKCIRRAQDLNDKCMNLIDCGNGALCLSGRCGCMQGYIPSKKNSIDCEIYKCDNTQQCKDMDESSLCDIYKNQCICKDGFYADSKTQKCSDFGQNVLMIVLIVVGSSLVVCSASVMIGIYFFKKRQNIRRYI